MAHKDAGILHHKYSFIFRKHSTTPQSEMLWHRTRLLSAYPELPTAALSDKLLEEPLVTRVSGFGFLDTVSDDWFSALRFFTVHKQ